MTGLARRLRLDLGALGAHTLLLAYCAVVLVPVALIVANSFKTRRAIFRSPLDLPWGQTFSLDGYATVLARADFLTYFLNSAFVTVGALMLIVLIGAMAAHALVEYDLPGSRLLGLYLALGIMIPIRLGTVGLVSLISGLGLTNSISGLVIVYAAQGVPLSTLILTEFLRQVPKELKDAARIDGASEYRIFFQLILPLTKPTISTVAVFTMIPIWNDLWFPLVLAPDERTRTVTLGAQQFLGQFAADWSALLAALTLSAIPVLVLYLVLSRQLIRGVTSGAVK